MNLPDIPGAPVEVLVFALMAFTAVVGAIAVISASDPFVSALSMLGNFVSLGVIFLLLHEPFVAISQVLVYAGAVVVLVLFVIAYLGDWRELPQDVIRSGRVRPVTAVAVGFGACLALLALFPSYPDVATIPASFGGAAAIGEEFLTTFELQFEVTSLVLLVAAIGGIVLGLTGRARHRRMRKLMHTRSADQQRRAYAERSRTAAAPDASSPQEPVA